MEHAEQHEHAACDVRHGSRWKWAAAVLLALAALLALAEYGAQLWGFLPYLIILACPLMHLFHHRGHRHTGRGQGQLAAQGKPGAPAPGEQ